MNGEFRLQDVQSFIDDAEKLKVEVHEISSINQCITNPTCGNARSRVGDMKREFTDDEVKSILMIKRRHRINAAKEHVDDIKKKYGVTIIVPKED